MENRDRNRLTSMDIKLIKIDQRDFRLNVWTDGSWEIYKSFSTKRVLKFRVEKIRVDDLTAVFCFCFGNLLFCTKDRDKVLALGVKLMRADVYHREIKIYVGNDVWKQYGQSFDSIEEMNAEKERLFSENSTVVFE